MPEHCAVNLNWRGQCLSLIAWQTSINVNREPEVPSNSLENNFKQDMALLMAWVRSPLDHNLATYILLGSIEALESWDREVASRDNMVTPKCPQRGEKMVIWDISLLKAEWLSPCPGPYSVLSLGKPLFTQWGVHKAKEMCPPKGQPLIYRPSLPIGL